MQEGIEYNVETGGAGPVLVNQCLDYCLRPKECGAMSVVEYFSVMEKKRKVFVRHCFSERY